MNIPASVAVLVVSAFGLIETLSADTLNFQLSGTQITITSGSTGMFAPLIGSTGSLAGGLMTLSGLPNLLFSGTLSQIQYSTLDAAFQIEQGTLVTWLTPPAASGVVYSQEGYSGSVLDAVTQKPLYAFNGALGGNTPIYISSPQDPVVPQLSACFHGNANPGTIVPGTCGFAQPPLAGGSINVVPVLNSNSLAYVSGGNQTGKFTPVSLAQPLTVQVTPPTSGVPVVFTITQSPPKSTQATLSTSPPAPQSNTVATVLSVPTDPNGFASVYLVVDVPGQYQVTASCDSCSTGSPVTFTETGSCVLPPSPSFNWSQGGSSTWAANPYDDSYYFRTSGLPEVPESMQLYIGSKQYVVQVPPDLQSLQTYLLAKFGGILNAVCTDLPNHLCSTSSSVLPNPLSIYYLGCQNTDCSSTKPSLHLCPTTVPPAPVCDPPNYTGDLLAAKTIQQVGCYLTSLAMAASFSSQDFSIMSPVNTVSGPIPLDPGQLNLFMSNRLPINSPAPGTVYSFTKNGEVDPNTTVANLGDNVRPSGNAWEWTAVATSNGGGTSTAAYATLDEPLCFLQTPMIVKVNSGHHFVLVTGDNGTGNTPAGQANPGSQYIVADPGNQADCSNSGCTLADYDNDFTTVGYISDPPDRSKLVISVDGNATALLTDSTGRQTGVVLAGGNAVQQIPNSAYESVQTVDELTGLSTDGVTNSISVGKPSQGQYTLTIIGLNTGPFSATITAFARDGSFLSLPLSGAVQAGATSTYAVNYSPVPGSAPQVLPATSPAPSTETSCNGAFIGTFMGNITVSGSQSCTFNGGGVTGNVTLQGGSLTLNKATVGGNVQVQGSGAVSILPLTSIGGNLQIQNLPPSMGNQVCGAVINGDLTYQNNAAPVVIGGTSRCPGNLVGGNLQISNNSAATAALNNTVSGTLQDQNNLVSTTITGNAIGGNLQVQNNASAQVSNNVVTNNLQCSNNRSISGGGNTAQQKQGQCTSF